MTKVPEVSVLIWSAGNQQGQVKTYNKQYKLAVKPQSLTPNSEIQLLFRIWNCNKYNTITSDMWLAVKQQSPKACESLSYPAEVNLP